MSTSLEDLIAQKAELDNAIAEIRRAERTQVIAQITALMAEHGLKPSDLLPPRHANGSAARKAPVKFRDEGTGDVWSGRGPQPRWLRDHLSAGRQIDEFRV